MTYEEALALITRIGAQSIMTPDERRFLFEIAREVTEQRIVEVGSSHGGTTILLALAGLHESTVPNVVSIDNRTDTVYGEFKSNLYAAGVSDYVTCLHMDSLEAVSCIDDWSCGLVIIDGDHWGERPYQDMKAYAAKLCVGGYLAVDDTSCGFPAVTNGLWQFLCEEGPRWAFVRSFEHPEWREPIIQIKLAVFRRLR